VSIEKEILLSNIDACKQRIEKLTYSLNKNRALFPLTIKSVAHLSDEQEDISNKSNRDKVLLMEKLGAVRSADEFGTAAAVLRNKFAHHYPEAIKDRIARLNLVIEEADFVIGVFEYF
jgi:DNA repair ATPase RecN